MTPDEADEIIDALFEDLRGRRFLKWLFCAEPERLWPILHDNRGEPLMALDRDVQNEIKAAWKKILLRKKG
jgi:hypothetical protein